MRDADTVYVLGISGSLRKACSNSALVSAAVHVAPVGVEVSVYGELGEVPPFNPDLDTDTAPRSSMPRAVRRSRMRRCGRR